jgi:hypothetical protein
MGEAIFMAPATTLVASHFEVPILWGLNLVCAVAIGADWRPSVSFG